MLGGDSYIKHKINGGHAPCTGVLTQKEQGCSPQHLLPYLDRSQKSKTTNKLTVVFTAVVTHFVTGICIPHFIEMMCY